MIVLSITVVCWCIHEERSETFAISGIGLKTQNGDVRILPLRCGEDAEWDLFFPAGISSDQYRFELENGIELEIDGKSYENGDSFFAFSQHAESMVTLRHKGRLIEQGVLRLHQAEQVDSLMLTISGGGSLEKVNKDLTKKTSVYVEFQAMFSDGTLAEHGRCLFGGRGNHTWAVEDVSYKKPYKLTMDDAQTLFGMNEARKWTLLANTFDDTYIRNHLAFEAARRLDCACVPQDEFVNLYVDGEYQGLYQLTQKVDMDGGILDEHADEGMLLEFNTEGWEGENEITFYSPDKYVSIVSPEVLDQEQYDATVEEICSIEKAIKRKDDTYRGMLEADSWMKQYLLHEVFVNKDVDFSSTFFYKSSDNDKWRAGPLWDFDRTFGLPEYTLRYNGTEQYVTWIQGMTTGYKVNAGWYKALYENPSFQEGVKRLYLDKFFHITQSLIEEYIPALQKELALSVRMDHIRHRLDPARQSKGVARLSQWLQNRSLFLREFWSDETQYIQVTFYTREIEDNSHDMVCYVKPGTSLEHFPDADIIVKWKSEDGTEITESHVFYEDTTVYPVTI